MAKLSLTFAVLLALTLATPNWAQEAQTEEQTNAAEAEQATQTETTQTETTQSEATQADGEESTERSIEDQLSMGVEESAEPRLNEPYTAEVIQDWELRCIRTEQEEDPCQMYQLMDDGEGAPVAEFSMFRLPEGGQAVAGATVIVPLETALTEQLSISVDGGAAKRYPFAFCNQVGCYARIGLTAADVAQFRRGSVARMTIVPALAPDQRVTLELSLLGFTASYEKVSVIDPN